MSTYGINYPFRDSTVGDYVSMSTTPEKEVRANLIHLLLTRKGSRYFLPDFGTRLYEYIFEQNDSVSYQQIEDEIREGVKTYIPNLDINSIKITNAEKDEENPVMPQEEQDGRLFRTSDSASKPYTAIVRIDYTVNNGAFSTSDFVIINI
jgi:phage baseplate assembly protein W